MLPVFGDPLTLTDHIEQVKQNTLLTSIANSFDHILRNNSLSPKDDEKVRKLCRQTGANYDATVQDIISDPEKYRCFFPAIVPRPSRQGIDEKQQILNLLQQHIEINRNSTSGKPKPKAFFDEQGRIVSKHDQVPGTKDLDYQISGIGSRKIYLTLKYITEVGGSQDNQRTEVFNTLKKAALNPEIVCIALVDGAARNQYLAWIKNNFGEMPDHIRAISSEELPETLSYFVVR